MNSYIQNEYCIFRKIIPGPLTLRYVLVKLLNFKKKKKKENNIRHPDNKAKVSYEGKTIRLVMKNFKLSASTEGEKAQVVI